MNRAYFGLLWIFPCACPLVCSADYSVILRISADCFDHYLQTLKVRHLTNDPGSGFAPLWSLVCRCCVRCVLCQLGPTKRTYPYCCGNCLSSHSIAALACCYHRRNLVSSSREKPTSANGTLNCPPGRVEWKRHEGDTFQQDVFLTGDCALSGTDSPSLLRPYTLICNTL